MTGETDKFQAGHRARLRERMLRDPLGIADYEILELVLARAYRRGDTKPLARALLAHFGSLAGVLNAHPGELEALPGVGPAVAFELLFQRVIIARYLENSIKKKTPLTLDKLAQLAKTRLAACPHEEVWAALLDNGNRLLTFERIHTGTVNEVLLAPRDAVELALKRKASGFVLVHNHPGGSTRPSTLDVEMTKHMRQAMENLGIRFLDHLIVADDMCYSLVKDFLL